MHLLREIIIVRSSLRDVEADTADLSCGRLALGSVHTHHTHGHSHHRSPGLHQPLIELLSIIFFISDETQAIIAILKSGRMAGNSEAPYGGGALG